MILKHVLMFVRQIPLLDYQKIDAFGVPDHKLDAAAVPMLQEFEIYISPVSNHDAAFGEVYLVSRNAVWHIGIGQMHKIRSGLFKIQHSVQLDAPLFLVDS